MFITAICVLFLVKPTDWFKKLAPLFHPIRNKTKTIDQFRYIKIQPNTIDLRTRLWGIDPTNSVVIPQSLVMRSIVLG